MQFNWLNLVQLIPITIMGIQQIHADAAGATKKRLALEALGLATGEADAVLPSAQKAIADSASNLIDNFVTMFHVTNAPGFGTSQAPAAS